MKSPLLALCAAAFVAAAALLAADTTRSIVSLSAPYPTIASVERLDSALDAILAPEVKIEKLAEGFRWSEGPVWRAQEADLIFSDVPANTAYRWREGKGVDVFLKPSGDTGATANASGEGSNGLTLDAQGRLILCQHSDRRVSRLAADGHGFETLAERYAGKRFNSPNDLCFDRAGNLFFTDPPYGLGKNATNEQGFCGVYRRAVDGTVTLLRRDLDRPNGIALSPDQKTLYVANSGDRPGMRTYLMAYALRPDGAVDAGRVLFDAEPLRAKRGGGLMDGLKVDARGNIWATGPGGVLILSPEGKHLGTIVTGTATANCCFGGADGATLYITANNLLLRVATRTKGAGF
jgi:gluconolactonase